MDQETTMLEHRICECFIFFVSVEMGMTLTTRPKRQSLDHPLGVMDQNLSTRQMDQFRYHVCQNKHSKDPGSVLAKYCTTYYSKRGLFLIRIPSAIYRVPEL